MFHNNGKGESHIVQNRFTRYLMTAVTHKKYSFLRVRSKIAKYELLTEFSDAEVFSSLPEKSVESDMLDGFENAALYKAIKRLNKRDRYVLLAHILDERDFTELAQYWGASYSAIASAYYRAIQKIRKEIGGDIQ